MNSGLQGTDCQGEKVHVELKHTAEGLKKQRGHLKAFQGWGVRFVSRVTSYDCGACTDCGMHVELKHTAEGLQQEGHLKAFQRWGVRICQELRLWASEVRTSVESTWS